MLTFPARKKLAWLAMLAALALVAAGCGVVHPPANPSDPVAVYVANYGIHSAVMLPLPDGRFVEYAFGDWGYCAYNKALPNDAMGALFLSGESAFGRRYIEMKPGQPYPTPKAMTPKAVFRIAAPRASVLAIEALFDERFQRTISTKVYNADNDTDYVRDDHHYSFANSCNHLTAWTLRNLGCDVDGPTFFSGFQLAAAPARKGRPLIPPSPTDPALTNPGVESSASVR